MAPRSVQKSVFRIRQRDCPPGGVGHSLGLGWGLHSMRKRLFSIMFGTRLSPVLCVLLAQCDHRAHEDRFPLSSPALAA